MKKTVPPELEKGRITVGRMATCAEDGFNGAFRVKVRGKTYILLISDGGGWEHVSVEVGSAKRIPTWEEMCRIKDLIWNEDEVVIQIHPAKKDYVMVHYYVLHLWRPVDQEIPLPPKIFV